MDGVIEEVPPSLFAEWQAAYLLRPWDAAGTHALVDGQFQRPDWLEDLVEKAEKQAKKADRGRKRSMTKGAILRAAHKKKTLLGWTWP